MSAYISSKLYHTSYYLKNPTRSHHFNSIWNHNSISKTRFPGLPSKSRPFPSFSSGLRPPQLLHKRPVRLLAQQEMNPKLTNFFGIGTMNNPPSVFQSSLKRTINQAFEKFQQECLKTDLSFFFFRLLAVLFRFFWSDFMHV